MILKALYDYFYSRPDRVPEGMCRKEIEYVIVIDRDGSFVRFESRRIDKKRCAELIVAAPVSLVVKCRSQRVVGQRQVCAWAE